MNSTICQLSIDMSKITVYPYATTVVAFLNVGMSAVFGHLSCELRYDRWHSLLIVIISFHTIYHSDSLSRIQTIDKNMQAMLCTYTMGQSIQLSTFAVFFFTYLYEIFVIPCGLVVSHFSFN